MTNTVRITNPSDLLALVPQYFGFTPTDSIAILTIAPVQFGARVDLPNVDGVVPAVTSLVPAFAQHGVSEAVVVIYSDSQATARAAYEALIAMPVTWRLAMFVNDSRYFNLDDPRDTGTPFDVRDHQFTAQGVLDGKAAHATSREQRARILDPDPAAVEATTRAISRFAALGVTTTSDDLWGLVDVTVPGEFTAAQLIGLCDPILRDETLIAFTRENASRYVDHFLDLVRESPVSHRSHPAALLALAAWLMGDGAFAWMALDACPDTSIGLHQIVTHLLENAVNPDMWAALRAALVDEVMPERNLWGTVRADVGEGFCSECESPYPFHLLSCDPARRATTKEYLHEVHLTIDSDDAAMVDDPTDEVARALDCS